MSNATRRRGRRQRDAWGAITEVEKGRRYRIRYWGKDPSGEYRRRSETVRGTRADAERRRAELMLDHSEDAPCPTVGQAWERWVLPALERRVELLTLAPRTLAQYRSAYNAHIAPTWAGVPLDSVRPLRVQQWLDTLGASQAAQAMKVMNAVMDAAVRYEYVVHNPMRERYVMPSKSTVRSRDAGIWTLGELLSIDATGQWWEPAFLLSAFGGLRVGESLGVRASDVELRKVDGVSVAFVSVARQVARDGSVSDALKTPQSRRTAYVVGRAAVRLSNLASAVPADWYLTNDGMGAPQPQVRLSRTWSGAGMAHPFRNLRNSWQTWMRWEVGVEPWAIEQAMGHVGHGVTGQYYDRPTSDVVARVFAAAYNANQWDDLGRNDS